MFTTHGVLKSILGGASILAFGYVLYASTTNHNAAQHVAIGPLTWVPFSAEYRVTHLGHESLGRYFRSSTGSTRTESYSPDGSQTAVTIKNVPAGQIYARSPVTGQWASLSLTALDTSLPTSMRVPEQTTERFGDLNVYRTEGPDGSTRLLAPDLNFFAVFVQSKNGRVREYFNIARGEPAASLFEPPAGEEIRVSTDLRDLGRLK